MKTVDETEICYKRTSLHSCEEFEVVLCEWSKGDVSPLHAHQWSLCHSLVQEGLFENTVVSGFKRTTHVLEVGQVMTVAPGASHEVKCLSNTGKTLHVYTPRIKTKSSPQLTQPDPNALKSKLSLELGKQGVGWQELSSILNEIEKNSISTDSVYFMNQLFAGVVPESLLSEQSLARTRTTLATFEASPALSLVEAEVVQKLGALAGWTTPEGVTVPGGSAANFMALHCARQNRFPQAKSKGLFASTQLRVFCSSDAHYSIKKACIALGFGSDSLISVKTDATGKMDCHDLTQQIQHCLSKNEVPLMVCATAGTTVYGAFDPIDQLADICEQHQIWLHVDGAWGGPALFSEKLRPLMNGIERADSLTFDAHKLFGAGLTCTSFVTRHPQILLQANDVSGAEYLFHNNSDMVDRGRLSWQCGRPAEALNFWTIWKSYGTSGLGDFVNRLLSVKNESLQWISHQPRLKLLADPDYLNICVQIIPPSERQSEIKTWSRYVRDELKRKNLCMVNYSTDANGLCFLRLILAHPQIQTAEVQQILQWSLDVN